MGVIPAWIKDLGVLREGRHAIRSERAFGGALRVRKGRKTWGRGVSGEAFW